MSILQPYLPPTPNDIDPTAPVAPPVSSTGGYAEGGSLYALGIIHGCDAGSCSDLRKQANDLLRSHLRSSHANEAISHGAALGVGLTAMGTNNIDILQELKEVLYTDSAVAGEAAAISMGLVLVGSGAGNLMDVSSLTSMGDQELTGSMNHSEEISELVIELKNYAKETQHEKIIRGIAMALALINYGQEDNADPTIDEMKASRDPIMRYGAQYALGLAYCGTGSNKAIRSLLHSAVSDVNDDVRAAAVISLAFVLFKTPERVPQIVKLLSESFNAHVRYASCMAVGIAMAGTGDAESLSLLEPMLSDMTDFVRQGALLGSSMIYMQQGDTCNGRKILQFREKLSTIIQDKHATTLTKIGAILGTGIIDAGGRNCSLDLGSHHGFTKMTNVVGLALWLQYWHWFPMMNMLSLTLTPTVTVGLNSDLKYPKSFHIECRTKPSTFAYPKKFEEKKEEKKKRVETVALSVTEKNKARLARKKAKDEEMKTTEPMEMEENDVVASMKKKREPEPNSFVLSNPCRVTKAQVEFCGFDLSQRYRPLYLEEKPFGVLILTDSQPDETDTLMGTILPPSMGADDEADPPEPFEWTPDDL
jgi:26S proteasome regulatory subunit N2